MRIIKYNIIIKYGYKGHTLRAPRQRKMRTFRQTHSVLNSIRKYYVIKTFETSMII
jgi:hypothetical protein